MKPFILIILTSILSFIGLSSTDTTYVHTEVNAVTIYPNGAQITREIKLKTKIGKSVLVFDGLPFNISQEHIQLASNKRQHIRSLKLIKVYGSSKKKTADIINIEDEIKAIRHQIILLNKTLELHNHEHQLLSKNSQLNSSTTTIPLNELKQTVEYFNSKMKTIETSRINIAVKKETFQDEIKALNKQLQALNNLKNKNSSQLIVIVNNKTIQETHYTLSYYSDQASWIPNYDFRVDAIDSDIITDYNATIFQSTDEDWKNVELTLATVDPVLNEPIKKLTPWILENDKKDDRSAVEKFHTQRLLYILILDPIS